MHVYHDQPMTASEIEVAVAYDIGIKQNMIVPNVWWGMGLSYECDLMYITKSGYAHEVEIKISKSDTKRDQSKLRHKYEKYESNSIIRSRTFAIPSYLESCVDLIPETCGIVLVSRKVNYYTGNIIPLMWDIKQVRKPVINTKARKLTDKEITHMGRLASMRVWGMKMKMLKYDMSLKKEGEI